MRRRIRKGDCGPRSRDRIEDINCLLDNEELTAENSRKLQSKRFAKEQQMQWTKKSAHLVLQMRTQVLDERLEDLSSLVSGLLDKTA